MQGSKYVSTKELLARRIGISYFRLQTNWDRPDRPKDHSSGRSRYDVAAYREWVAKWKSAHNFGSRNADDRNELGYPWNAREKALIEKNQVSAQRERFKLEVEMAEYVPRLVVNRVIDTGNRIIRNELEKAFQSELPPRLEGLSSVEIRRVLLAKLRQLTETLPAQMTQVYGNGNATGGTKHRA